MYMSRVDASDRIIVDVQSRNPKLNRLEASMLAREQFTLSELTQEDWETGGEALIQAYVVYFCGEGDLLHALEKIVQENPDRRNPMSGSGGAILGGSCLYQKVEHAGQADEETRNCLIGHLLTRHWRFTYERSWESGSSQNLLASLGFSSGVARLSRDVQRIADWRPDAETQPRTWDETWNEFRRVAPHHFTPAGTVR